MFLPFGTMTNKCHISAYDNLSKVNKRALVLVACFDNRCESLFD